jgi:hypothetical protein
MRKDLAAIQKPMIILPKKALKRDNRYQRDKKRKL